MLNLNSQCELSMTLRKFLLRLLKYTIRTKKEFELLNKVMQVMMSTVTCT